MMPALKRWRTGSYKVNTTWRGRSLHAGSAHVHVPLPGLGLHTTVTVRHQCQRETPEYGLHLLCVHTYCAHRLCVHRKGHCSWWRGEIHVRRSDGSEGERRQGGVGRWTPSVAFLSRLCVGPIGNTTPPRFVSPGGKRQYAHC